MTIMAPQPDEQAGKSLPQHFRVSLVMQCSPAENPWLDAAWRALGVLASGDETDQAHEPELIREEGAVRDYLYRGFSLSLHQDECESYYHNLMSPSPCCYLVASMADDGTPQPRLLTLSFDEAHAYLEGDEHLYNLPMPPEIYRWTEAYVLDHYVPRKRTKRKRRDWRRDAENPSP
jgi:hypothetical protein